MSRHEQLRVAFQFYRALLFPDGHWKVRLDLKSPVDPKDPDCYGACESDPTYRESTIFFDPGHEQWDKKEGGEVHPTVRHEMMHALIAPLAIFAREVVDREPDPKARAILVEWLKEVEEGVCVTLERAPLWGYLSSTPISIPSGGCPMCRK